MHRPNTLKAIIFDVDGTLAETEEAHRRAFNEAFAVFGTAWHWDPETYRTLLRVGGGRERIQNFAERTDPVFAASPAGQRLINELHAWKSRRYMDRVAGGLLLARPGVVRLIGEARSAGIRLACATPSTRTAVITLLRCILGPGGEAQFDTLVCGNDVVRKKPAPDAYRLAVESLGLQPEQCVAIEDTSVGLAAAASANLTTVLAMSDFTDEKVVPGERTFPQAIAVLSDLGEPDRPFTVLEGHAHGHTHVDIDLLAVWLREAHHPVNVPV